MRDTSIDHAPLLERAFEIEVVEGAWDLEPEGEIPPFLRGDYYLNGPSRFRVGEIAYRHWLDGDGAVSRLHFGGHSGGHSDGGTVRFAQRFVRSRKFMDERTEGRALYRTFGTSFEGDRLKRGIALESPANVSAFRFGKYLLAFGEQGLPYALDPTTLETHGEHTFDGRLNAVSPLSAHPCFDRESGEMFNFGVSFSSRQPSMTLYRFTPDGDLVYRRRHPLPYPCSTHDFILSDTYAIFYLSPYVLDVAGMMGGDQSIMDGLSWEPERGSRLLVFDRETGDAIADVSIGNRYCLHLINSFEEDPEASGDGSGRLVVDVVELERPVYDQYQVLPDLFVDAPSGGPRRFVLDRDTWEIVDRATVDYNVCPDFPAIDPRRAHRPYDDFWLLGMSAQGRPGRKFFDQVAHLRWSHPESPDVWNAPPHRYLGGEPVFLGDPASEDRGVVLCQEFDAESRRSAFLLFDAFSIDRGPIARLPVPHPMPLAFHASYEPL